MTKKSIHDLPEVIISNQSITKEISYYVKIGKLRKLISRVYTKNFIDSDEIIVKRNIWQIVSGLFPNAVISDRTAFENKPASDGSIFIVSSKKRAVTLPGFIIRPRKGAAALEDDFPFIESLHIASKARAFLENMKISRLRKGAVTRTVSQSETEKYLNILYTQTGEKGLNQLREQAKKIAIKIRSLTEYKKLNLLIGGFLGTQNLPLKSDLAIARLSGHPFDPKRIDLFQTLFEKLKNTAPVLRFSNLNTHQERVNFSFFESYFSNFIEGTEFEIQEAYHIIFENHIPEERPADAHDILGTYKIVSNQSEMKVKYKNFDTFIEILKNRHYAVMEGRTNKDPGKFKTKTNRVGETIFVDPELVIGTLKKGYEFYQALEMAFQKAVFMMFMITEIHPFLDGNGRVARIMMNAELEKNNEQKILIPTVYRNNYLSALRALSINQHPTPLIRVLDFGQKYSSSFNFGTFASIENDLRKTNAFVDPNFADEEGIRLMLL